MRKLLLMPVVLTIAMTGCSEKQETVNKEKVEVSEQVVKNQNEYINPEHNFTIHLDERLQNKLIIEDSDMTQIWFDDQTLLKTKVLVGKIDAFTINKWNQFKNEESQFNLVHYDTTNNMVYVFEQNADPYENHHTQDEHGEYLPPKESIEYDKLSQLFARSLLKSNFIYMGIETKQTLGTPFDPGSLEMAEEWHHTLQVAMEDLEEVMKKNDREILGNRLNSLTSELNANSPLTTQFSYPTVELGHNLIEAYDRFQWLVEPPFYDEETNQLAIENQMLIILQYLNTIEKQIKEITAK